MRGAVHSAGNQAPARIGKANLTHFKLGNAEKRLPSLNILEGVRLKALRKHSAETTCQERPL